MSNIETYRSVEFFSPSRASISGLPEQIGLKQEEVLFTLVNTTTLDDAKVFVEDYLKHMQNSIDEEHENDAAALTRLHLIEQMYFAYAPVELKPDHPANIKATARTLKSKRLIVEAMIDLFEPDYPLFANSDNPSEREYDSIRQQILAERRLASQLA